MNMSNKHININSGNDFSTPDKQGSQSSQPQMPKKKESKLAQILNAEPSADKKKTARKLTGGSNGTGKNSANISAKQSVTTTKKLSTSTLSPSTNVNSNPSNPSNLSNPSNPTSNHSNKANQNTNISSPKNNQNSISDEYQGISYKSSKITPIKTVDLCEEKTEIQKKKSIEKDFRVKYKTEQCKFYEVNKECKYGDNCAFAHGNNDIRNKPTITNNYKTKKCKQFFESGYCPYGYRCQFLHKESPKNSDTFSPRFSYKKSMNELINSPSSSTSNNMEHLSEELMKRPRLKTFENITHSKINVEENKHNLYEDIMFLQKENLILYELDPSKDRIESPRSRFMSA